MFQFLKNSSADKALADALSRSQAVIEFGMDGTILTANDNFLKALGYSLGEIQGKHHSMFVDPSERDSAAYRDFWAALKRGEYQAAEYKRIGKGGKEVWIQATYNPVLDAQRQAGQGREICDRHYRAQDQEHGGRRPDRGDRPGAGGHCVRNGRHHRHRQ